MGKHKRSPVVIFLIALAALYVIIYILPRVTGALQASYTAEYGELRIGDRTEGYFVRNEYVYFSAKTGEEKRFIEENKLVRKGTQIMEIVSKKDRDPEAEEEGKASNDGLGTYERFRQNIKGKHKITTEDYKSLSEGIITYHADGFESMLTPKNMGEKKKSFFKKLSNSDNIDLSRDTVLETDPVFKICDRSKWYIICYVPRDSEKRYSEGTSVDIEIDGGETITGKVMAVTDERREKRLTIKTDYYFKGFATMRKAEIEVITEDVMGLIISNSSITKKKGKEGVYIRQKTGKYKFVPISVIATDGKRSAIREATFIDSKGDSVKTVRSYDDVLRRP